MEFGTNQKLMLWFLLYIQIGMATSSLWSDEYDSYNSPSAVRRDENENHLDGRLNEYYARAPKNAPPPPPATPPGPISCGGQCTSCSSTANFAACGGENSDNSCQISGDGTYVACGGSAIQCMSSKDGSHVACGGRAQSCMATNTAVACGGEALQCALSLDGVSAGACGGKANYCQQWGQSGVG